MKSKTLFSVILSAGLMFANFSIHQASAQTPQDNPVKQEMVKYTCPMHSEVISKEPGKCPTCGMALVEKKDMHGEAMQRVHDSTSVKHEHMNMKKDTTTMKKEKMMPDTLRMKKAHMMNDTTHKKHDTMER